MQGSGSPPGAGGKPNSGVIAWVGRVILGQDPALNLRGPWERVLAFFGMHVPQGRQDRLHVRPRFFKVLGVGAVLFLAFGAFFFLKVSTSPALCRSCHIMRPYYQAWATSKHSHVPCVDCHYPPGLRDTVRVKIQAMTQVVKWATQTYSSKPFAEVEDASCLRSQCHSERLLHGEVTFKRGIKFDHRPHLELERRGMRLRCTSCHSQIVVGTHMEVTETTCYLCHFKGRKEGRKLAPLGGCPSCHRPPEKEVVLASGERFLHKSFLASGHAACESCHLNAVVGSGEAPREHCFVCHNEPEKLRKYGDPHALHENHVAGHNIECSRCHTAIEHRLQSVKVTPRATDCSICHEDKHRGPQLLYAGTGGIGSPDIPSHMLEVRVYCNGCHDRRTDDGKGGLAGATYRASVEACVKCHGDAYSGMLETWRDTLKEMGAVVGRKLQAVQDLVRSAREKDPVVGKLVADAEFNLRLVTEGKGIHNVFYSAHLLDLADQWVVQAAAKTGGTLAPQPGDDLVRGGYCARLCHAGAGVGLPEDRTFHGRPFPHARHFREFGVVCTRCHSPEKHKAIHATADTCDSCHHGNGGRGRDCKDCHPSQVALYQGTFGRALGLKDSPNPMFGKVQCQECHDPTDNRQPLVDQVRKKCTDCHDNSYAETISETATAHAAKAREVATRLRGPDGKPKDAAAARALEVLETLDRARAIHNPDLAEAVLEKLKQ